MARTLESVLRQSIPPTLWVIVDDGSTDSTPRILEEYRAKMPNLRIVRRADRGVRKVGGGVIDAFNDGLATVRLTDFQYVCKLDLDLELPPTYFEGLIHRMEHDPRLGTCSGKPYYRLRNGKLVDERCGDENSVGMTKFYRTTCFQAIGGFESEVMWDGIDCHRCRMLGWRSASFRDESLRFEHLRPMGSSHRSIWTGRARHGFGQYYMGSSLAYVLASATLRIFDKPRVTGSLAMLWGYLSAMARRANRYDDPEFRKYLRKYQSLSLILGKASANSLLERERASKWANVNGESTLDLVPH